MVTYYLRLLAQQCCTVFYRRTISYFTLPIIFQAYGGLRGAVTFSLVFMLDYNLLEHKEKGKNVLLTAAYLLIFFTTFFQVSNLYAYYYIDRSSDVLATDLYSFEQGISIKPLVKKMRIHLETKDTTLFKEINQAVSDLHFQMSGSAQCILQ